MPLLELDGRTAWQNIYNDGARWPRLDSPSRLDVIARPGFAASFKIRPGAKIFTMGSCFARNIEEHLAEHGFDVPSRRYFGGSHVINLYNPFSILQEIRWALGIARRLDPDERLLRVDDGAWVDPYMHHGSPLPRDELLSWIDRSATMFSEIKDCQYFIITLGLIEVWFDKERFAYLNEPLNFGKLYRENKTMQNYFADRFLFRVLSFQEAYGAVQEALLLLKENAAANCKILLTVSPVPLSGSFTGKDVLLANTYSKSVLRTVAEEICARFDFVDYFPSYESVMLSNRPEVWDDDGVHVKDAAVALNVRRMVEAYVDTAVAASA